MRTCRIFKKNIFAYSPRCALLILIADRPGFEQRGLCQLFLLKIRIICKLQLHHAVSQWTNIGVFHASRTAKRIVLVIIHLITLLPVFLGFVGDYDYDYSGSVCFSIIWQAVWPLRFWKRINSLKVKSSNMRPRDNSTECFLYLASLYY